MTNAITADTITADNITDEQIRELWIAMRDEQTYERWPDGTGAMMLVTDLALQRHQSGPRLPTPAAIQAARVRCAQILNSRAAAVTAETITDAQIDEVYRLGCNDGVHGNPDVMHVATVAKNKHSDFTAGEQRKARATCARVLNARRPA